MLSGVGKLSLPFTFEWLIFPPLQWFLPFSPSVVITFLPVFLFLFSLPLSDVLCSSFLFFPDVTPYLFWFGTNICFSYFLSPSSFFFPEYFLFPH